MAQPLSTDALDQLFREARTYRAWLDKPVSDETLHELYDLLKWGPTSANSSPARFVFIRSPEAKERLRPTLAPGNVEKTMTAPITVIVAYDLHFYEQASKLFPKNTFMRDLFMRDPQFTEETARRNSSLQGGYMILAARALGLDCGPMSGFDNAKLDEEFFPAGHVKSNFLCNLGYGDPAKLPARAARLDFSEAATIL
jgi:3-hydroxypropanoate dehydrogenase